MNTGISSLPDTHTDLALEEDEKQMTCWRTEQELPQTAVRRLYSTVGDWKPQHPKECECALGDLDLDESTMSTK